MMKPRITGGGGTTADFLSQLVQGTSATASFGSWNLIDGPAGNVWYNYIYIPHRNGVNGDNYRYGTLIVFGMTINSSNFWQNHLIDGNWYGWLGN